LLLLLIIKCILIAKDSKDLMGTLIITGVAAMIAFQTFVNVGVVTGMLPNTGIPLPFISYGLSSLLTNMMAFGLVLNVSIQRKPIY
jgi:rod shape determining protein RodA